MLLQRDAHPQQQFARARLSGITVHLAVFYFQIGDFIAVFFAHFRQGIDTVALLLDFPQFAMPHNDSIKNGECFKSELVLTQLTDALIRIEETLPSVGSVAAEDFHKSGLSATVGADQAVTVAAAKFDGNVFEQRLTAELHGNVAGN